MRTPSRPIGQDPQSQMLWYVSKQLEELKKITSVSSSTSIGSTGDPTDAPASSSAAETAAAQTTISLLKGIKNVQLAGTQKTQIVDSGGTALPLITSIEDVELSVDEMKAVLTNNTQTAQMINSAGVSSDQIYRTFELVIIRPENQTEYTLGDCIGNASEALPKFLAVAKAAGMGVNIPNVRAKTTDTALAGKAIKVHFFSDTITPVADNAAFAIPDATKHKSYAEITFGASGSLSKFAKSETENIILNPVGVDIPVQVEGPAFTPSANSTTITIEIGVILTA